MSITRRRFEILLPRRFNDGQAVPDDLLGETLQELRRQFGAVSSDWVRVFVDVFDNSDNREFFIGLKERLKARFRQIDIWMTTYLIEVV